MTRHLVSLALAAALLINPAVAGTLIDLSAEASRPAPNDLLRATVFIEATDTNPAELARRVNGELAQALKMAKGKPALTVKTGGQHSFPVYGKNRLIENWRMRAELLIESRDAAAVSELLGQLQQQRLALANIQQLPAPETRRQVEDEATRDALQAFEARAQLVAGILGKPYRIRQLNIQHAGNHYPMPMPVARSVAMMADAAPPVPVEAGTTQLTTVISGQIELVD
jgi:predicted secreted protein